MVSMDTAHDSAVFALDWHPLGHILVSGSNDHSTRFWTRNRPGERSDDIVSAMKEAEVAEGMYWLVNTYHSTLRLNM